MFTDGRSKRVIQALLEDNVGVVQLPCPEVSCLGLDRVRTLL